MAQLIANERVDDIPLLLNQMQKLNLSDLVDEYFKSHGNWKGISLGKVVVGWLAYILSQGDHRLNQVEDLGLMGSKETFKVGLDPAVRSLDFSDDHLETVLDQFSNDEQWDSFEGALSRHTLRVYRLSRECIRLDTTTAYGHREVEAEGLFQFGHSKDYRPDLPQVKISQAALDPLGLPVSTTVVSGNRGDDPLYIPEIEKVQASVQSSGLLYVGDSKMSALETRGYIAQSDNHYLCPLPAVQVSQADLGELLAPMWRGEESLRQVESQIKGNEPASEEPSAPPEVIAEGFDVTMTQSLGDGVEAFTWKENWLVVHSFKQGDRQRKAWISALRKLQTPLPNLMSPVEDVNDYRWMKPSVNSGNYGRSDSGNYGR
ncbi:hypothetical protein Lepto7375DRAFT_6320 [Leptolyngbya sp. PCC 7375]|nr:hypothetical protein Lepto7375DRAFT_6320 [Leptolyngbya sp. PCC 7375]